jgi:hypothetical protein
MFPSIIFSIIVFFLLIETTKLTSISSKSIVIQVKGDCKTLGDQIAQEHGYRYVRSVCFIKSKIHDEINLLRFLMIFVKWKKIHYQKIISDIDEL